METFALSTFVAQSLSGALVGFLVGITGVGGGSLMTPLLTLFLGVPATIAVGTDLAFAAITKTFGIAAHHTTQLIQWPVVRRLMLGSVPAALITTLVLKLTHFEETGSLYVRYVIAFSVTLTILGLIFRPKLLNTINGWKNWPLQGRPLLLLTALIGALIGVMVTVSSIGAGVVGVIAIIFLHPQLSPAQIAATDIAYAVPLTAVAALGHVWLNTVDINLLVSLLVGSIPAIWFGAKLSKRLPERAVRGTLVVVLALVAFKMIYR